MTVRLQKISDSLKNIWRTDEFRVRVILLVIAASALVTVFLLLITLLQNGKIDTATVTGSVFCSWIASVVFFFANGGIIAYASLMRPEHESYKSRARALFRGRQGKHINYIIDRMERLFEAYTNIATYRIIIHDVVEPIGAAKLRAYAETNINSDVQGFIDDIDTHCESYVAYKIYDPAGPGMKSNRLNYIHLDGKELVPCVPFLDKLSQKFEFDIPAFHTRQLNSSFSCWITLNEEENNWDSTRFVGRLRILAQNLSGIPLSIRYKRTEALEFITTELNTSSELEIDNIENVSAYRKVFFYYIDAADDVRGAALPTARVDEAAKHTPLNV